MEGKQEQAVIHTPFNYVEDTISELVCAVCLDPFVEPLETSCGHTFCKQCIHDLTTNSCPQCRQIIDLDEVVPPNRIITNILGQLKVYCPHKDEGCKNEIAR